MKRSVFGSSPTFRCSMSTTSYAKFQEHIMADTESSAALQAWLLRPPIALPTATAGLARKPILFCIPQAGMGAWVYHKIAKQLQDCVTVLPVELPGHNSRLREPPSTDLKQLAARIASVVTATSGGVPFALLGHSMGAWLVYEVAQELRQRKASQPLAVIVIANRAPHLCGAEHDVDPTRLSQLSSNDFWAAFTRRYGPNKNLEHPSIRQAVWPVLKADFTMVETYQHDNSLPPLDAPLIVIAAELDNRYTPQQVASWQQHAAAGYTEVWLKGVGHNCVADPPDALIAAIRHALQPTVHQTSC